MGLPLPDHPQTPVWRLYADRAQEEGAAKVLRGALSQFSFPVAQGMSQDEEYQAATRRGAIPFFLEKATGLELVDPLGLRVLVHDAPAGAIPFITTPERADFEILVQALSRKNEPWPVPPEMELCTVSGLVNWDRVRRLRKAFKATSPEGDWEARLKELAGEPGMIRDRIVLMHREPFGGLDAADLDMDWQEWADASVKLRAEREATHFFLEEVFGSGGTTPMGELLADYMGIVEAFGSYRSGVALRLLGLEDPHGTVEGGRLADGTDPPLSPEGLTVLGRILRQAVANLHAFDAKLKGKERDVRGRTRTLMALAGFHLEELARKGAPKRIRKARRRVKVRRG